MLLKRLLRTSAFSNALALWLWRHRSEVREWARSSPSLWRRTFAGEGRQALAEIRPIAQEARSIDRARRRQAGERAGLAQRMSMLRRGAAGIPSVRNNTTSIEAKAVSFDPLIPAPTHPA